MLVSGIIRPLQPLIYHSGCISSFINTNQSVAKFELLFQTSGFRYLWYYCYLSPPIIQIQAANSDMATTPLFPRSFATFLRCRFIIRLFCPCSICFNHCKRNWPGHKPEWKYLCKSWSTAAYDFTERTAPELAGERCCGFMEVVTSWAALR